MKTSVETVDPVTMKLTVEVEPKRVKQAFDKAARELAKQVNIPGFRPGKAPRRLLEQRFGDGAIAQAAMEEALSDYYVEALREKELDVVAQPEVDVEVFDEAEGARFTATVEVRPTFDPPDYTGIGVTFPDYEVDEGDVTEQLNNLRERFAEVDEVDRPAESGDMVTLDLTVEIDGEPLEDATVEDAFYEVGSAGVTPKLDDEVVGKSAGDTFSYDDEMPEGYPEHGGKPATFNVHVKDVRAKTLPDLDDDFATTASAFDTIDELRDDIRNSLLRRKIQEAQHDLRGRILEAYLARVEVPLPESMVESEAQARIDQLQQQASQYGMDVDTILAAEDTTLEDFEENARNQARSGVKAQLVLDALSQELSIDLDPQDIDQEIVRHAQSNQMPPEEIANIIEQQGSLPMLIGDIMRRRTIDTIVDAADVDGGPSDEQLIELGLMDDPNASDGGNEAPGLIVPGQDTGGEAGELIVPGKD